MSVLEGKADFRLLGRTSQFDPKRMLSQVVTPARPLPFPHCIKTRVLQIGLVAQNGQ